MFDAACALGILTGGIGSLSGHESPATAIFLDYRLEEEALVVIIEGATHHFAPLAEIDAASPPADASIYGAAYLDFLASVCPVVIDGRAVRPELEQFDFSPLTDEILPGREGTLQLALTTVRYPLSGRPSELELTWGAFPQPPPGFTAEEFEETGHVSMDEIFASYRIGDGAPDFVQFSPGSPKVVWRPGVSMTGTLSGGEPLPVSLEELQFIHAVPAREFALPVLTVLLGMVALVPLAGRPRGLGWKFRWRVAVVLLASALFVRHRAVWAVPLPDPRASELLDAEEARTLFTALHRNIYTAFDQETPDAIYDVLALSIDGPLLDRVYTEVYQSLVLEEADGAIATVRSVDMLECTPEPVDDGSGFGIGAEWTVEGYVAHSGHIHLRRNRYRANYRMEPIDGLWKITEVETVLGERILAEEQPGDQPLPPVPIPDGGDRPPDADLFPAGTPDAIDEAP